MKRNMKIFMCLMALLVVSVTAMAMGSVDVVAVGHQLHANAGALVASAAIISASITPEMINDAKLKYLHVQLLTIRVTSETLDASGAVVTPAEQYQFIVRRPDRSLIKMLLPLAGDTSQLDVFADSAVKNLIVGGDMAALDDGLVFMGVVSQLKDLIQPASAFLETA
jgi:hypothetical protein